MPESDTTELLHLFSKVRTEKDMERYLSRHASTPSIQDYFNEYFASHSITTAEIVSRCKGLISKSYIYDLLNGQKTQPSRDIVLMLCLAAHMNWKETRRTLELFQLREIYVKDPRDIIIATAINQEQFDIDQINDKLAAHGLTVLNGG